MPGPSLQRAATVWPEQIQPRIRNIISSYVGLLGSVDLWHANVSAVCAQPVLSLEGLLWQPTLQGLQRRENWWRAHFDAL